VVVESWFVGQTASCLLREQQARCITEGLRATAIQTAYGQQWTFELKLFNKELAATATQSWHGKQHDMNTAKVAKGKKKKAGTPAPGKTPLESFASCRRCRPCGQTSHTWYSRPPPWKPPGGWRLGIRFRLVSCWDPVSGCLIVSSISRCRPYRNVFQTSTLKTTRVS